MKTLDFQTMTVREIKAWMAHHPNHEAFEEAQDTLHEIYAEQDAEREMYGMHDDSPSLANCDDWGTGEGRYHGRI